MEMEKIVVIKKIFMDIHSPKPKILDDNFGEFDQCEYSLASLKKQRQEKLRENLRANYAARRKNDGRDFSFKDSESEEFEMDNRSLLSLLMRDDTATLGGIGIKKIGLNN